MRQISTFLVCGYDKEESEKENGPCLQYLHIHTEDSELYFGLKILVKCTAVCPKSTMKNLSDSVTFVVI